MAVTSAVIPPVAVAHRFREVAARRPCWDDAERAPLGRPRSLLALQPPPVWSRLAAAAPGGARSTSVGARRRCCSTGTGLLIEDLPGNTDPGRVAAMPGARAAIRRARSEGLAVGVVTNQSAVGRGTATLEQVEAVNRRVDELLGPFDIWQVCPHVPTDGCDAGNRPQGWSRRPRPRWASIPAPAR